MVNFGEHLAAFGKPLNVGKHPVRQLEWDRPTSNHHQAVERLGTDLEAVQWARDGVIEAVVHKKLPIWGVQWHPERQSYDRVRDDAVDAAALFHYFLSQEAKK